MAFGKATIHSCDTNSTCLARKRRILIKTYILKLINVSEAWRKLEYSMQPRVWDDCGNWRKGCSNGWEEIESNQGRGQNEMSSQRALKLGGMARCKGVIDKSR